MVALTLSLQLPSQLKPSLVPQQHNQSSLFIYKRKTRPKKNQFIVPVARLFGPAIFEASKLRVLFLGVDEKKHPGKLPRTYTLTHSDITSKLTLAISQTINNSQLQGWYNRLQRDEVVAEWKKVKGKMSLHVHCHISGGHFLLDLFARLRYFIFSKELPMVLKAFVHGDGNLFSSYPELQEASVWVYFHSNIPEFNKVECWGPLYDPSAPGGGTGGFNKDPSHVTLPSNLDIPQPCQEDCTCCFPPVSLIPWAQQDLPPQDHNSPQENLQQQISVIFLSTVSLLSVNVPVLSLHSTSIPAISLMVVILLVMAPPPCARAMDVIIAASITYDRGFHINPKNFKTLLSFFSSSLLYPNKSNRSCTPSEVKPSLVQFRCSKTS